MRKNIPLVVLLAAIILIAATIPLKSNAAGTVSLPRTGQTASYATGDDGDLRVGVAWPASRFTVSGDCVTDNLTGLVWAKNANLNGGAQTWDSAVDHAKGQTLCGRSDWRLPNVNELESLIDASASVPATWLISQGFIGAQPNPYWTSTTYVNQTDMAWYVCLCDGGTGTGPKANSTQVYSLPVAGITSLPAKIWKTGQTEVYRDGDDGTRQDGVACPIPRFTVNTDSSITDNLTGLIWAPDGNIMKIRDPSWDDYGVSDGKVKWQRAVDYVAKLNSESYLGHSDWRLPNRKEGFSITDRTMYGPSLPAGHPFTNIMLGSYWTSTTFAYDTAYDTTFGTWTGAIGKAVKIAGDSYVWPVRGGGSTLVVPTVTTITISAITDSTAAGGGNVPADGGATVTARGVCWGTSANPTTADSHTTDGSGTGSFTSAITGLSPATSYFVRAYATNSAGTAYGDDVQFQTQPAHVIHFEVSAPATATTGAPFNFTVTALDQSNATVTGYTGTIHFTSSDTAAVLPANATLSNGMGTFSATFNTAGNRTITVTDMVTASNTGTSGDITVSYPKPPNGNVNGDGQVNIVDALMALRASANLITPTAEEMMRGDVAPFYGNGSHPDGKMDISDALVILRKCVQ